MYLPTYMTRQHQTLSSRSFTLVEILTVLVLVAALITGAVMFTSGYVTWSKQTADKQTLTVLNDALTRYKTQGGNVNALTSGAPIRNVMARLGQTVSWGNISHQFLQTGITYPARSIYAKGTGAQYRFSAFNTYTNETGGTSPTPSGTISLSGSLDFFSAYGIIDWASSADLTLTVSNTGGGTLNVTAVNITGAGAAKFHATHTSFSVAPGGSDTVTITFGPTQPNTGTFNATITVVSDAGSGTNTASATGQGDIPEA